MKPDPKLRERYRADFEKCVYVVEFTTGVVKVGQARRGEQRIAHHGRVAERHGATIARSWMSASHKEYAQNEAALIAFCAESWPLAGGKEYFAGADYDRVVAYAHRLPMNSLTEADIDEYERRVAENKHNANAFVDSVFAIGEALRMRAQAREAADESPGQDEEEHILLEDIAPEGEYAEDVTAASLATHHAALALINHHLRLKLDPFKDTRAWKEAFQAASSSYSVTLLLRALQEQVGQAFADDVARRLWSDSHELSGDWGEQLATWVIEDGLDPECLHEMARVSYEQAQKFKAKYQRPQQGELPLGGEA